MGPGQFDRERVAAAVREILDAIGEDPQRPGFTKTPERVADSYAELFSGLNTNPADVLTTTFEADHDELVLVKDIDFFSTCEHHLVPFRGVAHVGYIPAKDGRIAGLSALVRLVEAFSRRPQVQERLTSQIADTLVEQLEARGVIVVIEAEHLCMTMRGVRNVGAKAVTSAVRGWFKNSPAARAEAMSLIHSGR
ncbi:MAG: GTP cyclohydrolase I FolE [Corynebacteriales bacterium]|nr:GTP cyclohydrolase I FolE [Mycobacteriales bacterium]